ncbi:hypothetical protein BGZ83_001035 [Gryganskiella cystojenkinii]|nr:hypothetical protein BGZ83_001035 [Gryganskiella cystojenkinii]
MIENTTVFSSSKPIQPAFLPHPSIPLLDAFHFFTGIGVGSERNLFKRAPWAPKHVAPSTDPSRGIISGNSRKRPGSEYLDQLDTDQD